MGSLSTFPGLDKEFYIWEKEKTQLPGKQKKSAEGTLGCIL